MLQAVPTKRGTGLLVLGDYYDLQNLYAAVHKFADRAEKAQPPHNGLLLGFAYELRKAYDGKRLTHHDPATGITYSGLQYLWTDMLLITNILRFQAGHVLLTDVEQACLYPDGSSHEIGPDGLRPAGSIRSEGAGRARPVDSRAPAGANDSTNRPAVHAG
jgi:hypothetical protein